MRIFLESAESPSIFEWILDQRILSEINQDISIILIGTSKILGEYNIKNGERIRVENETTDFSRHLGQNRIAFMSQ